MGLGDDILKKLRDVFGRERKEQMAAESPSSELALAPNPSSPVGTLAGQDRGLLTISPTLMGRYQDYECLVGETSVLTLMGPVTLKELSDLCGRDSSYQFAVYTWDHKEGRITVGMGCRARWVKKAKVVEVELDDGQKFLATENHRWMRRDGSYAETKELSVGDSLMPLYLSKDTNGYVMYRENSDWHKGANTRKDRAKTRAVARMAAEWKLGRRMNPGEYVFINIPDRGRVDVDKMVIKPKEEVQTTRTLSVTPLTQLAWEIALFVKENERLAVDPKAKAAAQDLVKDKRKLGLNSVLPEEREKAKRFWNHKIAALRDTGTEQDVYCLDVPGTHNYAIGNESGGVFNHNCMSDYPDINCLAGDTKIVVYENSIVKEVSIGEMASSNLTYRVVVWNKQTGMLEVADAIEPRLSGREADVFEIKMSNGRTLKATAEHKVLVKKEDLHYTYKDFIDLKAGDKLVGMPGGYSERIAQSFLFRKPHEELVLCDPYPAGKDSVYDITTEAHNFVANGVVVHNSALWYFGSDSTQPHPTTGRVVWVDSDDEAIKGASETLLRRRLRIDDEMFSFAYELAKMGNLFLEPLVTENGVVGLNCLATHTVRRIEHENKALVGYAQDLSGMLPEEPNEIRKIIAQGDRKDIALFEDWQVVHARLRATSPRSSYGRSVVDGARWIWKRLLMLEDSMILYKLTRAAARYAYYIDVTDIPANKVEAFLQKAKRDLKKHKYVDPNTGQMNMRFNPLCLAGDTLIETRDGPIKIEDLVIGFQNGLMFEVYTSDVDNGGRVGFGKVVWAGKTRENAELLKITLDNGHVVRVTPDHKMIRRSGEYAEAQDLQIGDSLMPFYLKESKGEDVVYCPQRRKFVSILSLEPKDIDVPSHNHRVIGIERLSEREDTYTLTVEPVHTFALSAGIFVKNSNDEDIILAVRDGRELSRVEVLSGADYQCLVGSTEIPLLDGSKKTIKEMAEDGGEFWVYSCTEKGEVVPAVARNARISHNSAEIWEVELDNGEIVECTGNHPFLTRAGNWILAENLEPGDSLMPLYRRVTTKEARDRIVGYEKIYDPASNKWVYTHQLVYDALNEDKGWIKGTVIHHESGKLDNRPEVLKRLSRHEHSLAHLDNVKRLHTEDVRAKVRETQASDSYKQKISESWETGGRRQQARDRMVKRMASSEERAKKSLLLSEWNKTEDHKSRVRGSKNVNWRADLETIADLSALVKRTGAKTFRELVDLGKVTQPVIERILKAEGMRWSDFASRHIEGWVAKGRAKSKTPPAYLNHKVVSVKRTGRFETVYDLTVDGTHCFAVGQGVFVHNSIDDVSYFQRKLHGVLKVPRTWLGQEDAPPGRALLSNEDSRSARVTMTIQTSLRLMVERIIRIDMAARGVSNPWKPIVDVQMTQPSGIATLAYMEVQNALADYATRIEPYVSKDFIRRHYLKLTEDQIDTIEKQKEREKKVDSGGGGGFGSFSAAPEFVNAMESIGLTPENAKALGMTQGMVTKLSDNIRRLEERFDRVSKERHDHLEKKLEQVLQKDAAFRDRHNERMAFFRQLSEMQKRNRH